MAVGRGEADRDDGNGRAGGCDERFRGRSAEGFIGQTFAQYICVCITQVVKYVLSNLDFAQYTSHFVVALCLDYAYLNIFMT